MKVYERVVAGAPAGQDYFEQPIPRSYGIADTTVEITIEMYRVPRKMVEDISALSAYPTIGDPLERLIMSPDAVRYWRKML